MELNELLGLIRRWIWLLVLGLLLGAGGAFVANQRQTPVYEASTKLMVRAAPKSNEVDLGTLSTRELVETYIQLLLTEPVLRATRENLGFYVSSGQINARQIGGTGLLQVTVRADDPERAALIANQVVEVLIEQNEELQASLFTSSERNLQAQIAQVEEQIATLQAEINEQSEGNLESKEREIVAELQTVEGEILVLQTEIAELEVEIEALTPQVIPGEPVPTLTPNQRQTLSDLKAELAHKEFQLGFAMEDYTTLAAGPGTEVDNAERTRVDQQQTTLALYRQIYSNLLNSYETVRLARLQSSAHVIQVEEATPSSRPIQSNILQDIALGAAVGLIIMAGIAFLIEYLDTTLKTPGDVKSVLELPVIGYVGMIPNGDNGDKPHVLAKPHSPVAESLRTLRTNLEFADAEKPLKTILLTSPGPDQGKTTLLSNLAIVMAQAGHRVLLIDADLRRPAQHVAFNLSDKRGLTSLLLESSIVDEDASFMHFLDDTVQGTRVEGLDILTCGPIPPNPSEMLGSRRMTHLLERVKEIADLIFIDSPPLLVADASVLAARVDGVIILIEPGKTQAAAARAMIDQLNRAGARVLGVVLNRLSKNAAGFYGAYEQYYASTNYSEQATKENGRLGRRSFRNRLTNSSSQVR